MRKLKNHKIIIMLVFCIYSINTFAFWGLAVDAGVDLVRYQIAVKNMNANVLSKLQSITSTMREIEEMEEQAKRWKYILENLDPSNMKGQIEDFYDFVSRYRKYTNNVANTFNDVTGFEDQFYRTFKKASSIVGVNMNELNRSRENTKEMVQETVHDSMKLVVDMTGSNNKDESYVKQQEKWVERVVTGEVDPKKISQTVTEGVIQTNNLFLELKAINMSMLTQLSLIEQEGLEEGKITDEELRQIMEKNKEILQKNKTNAKENGELKM